MAKKFTPSRSQRKLLSFLFSYMEKNGYQPSSVEIAKALRCSKRYVNQVIEDLQRKGIFGRSDPRAIQVVGAYFRVIWPGRLAVDREIFSFGVEEEE